MSSSKSIHSSVNPTNHRAMIDATWKCGRYPDLRKLAVPQPSANSRARGS
ncbi:MAG: hypothetical protein HY508_05905 [Acidobacteria bacterium]|nr:hypothetical protein [Acidobacteriota bacterium]